MLWLYTLSFRIFLKIGPLFAWVSPKFAVWLRTREQWRNDLMHFTKSRRLVWFHCASVGEFEQARPIIDALYDAGSWQIVVTFFSSSGYELRKNYAKSHAITYLPADLPEYMTEFVARLTPDLVVFVKYEFWWNAMNVVDQRRIPMILISAYLNDKHWTTQWPGILLGHRLNQFTKIFTQDQATVNRLASVFIDQAEAVGDTRVDRVIANATQPFQSDPLDQFCGTDKVLVIGSNWPEDDAIIQDVLWTEVGIKVIIAPHEMDLGQISAWEQRYGEQMARWSALEKRDLTAVRLLCIDHVGLLSKLYSYADVAYVGGGFGKAVHNTLEAAVFGIPVIFGPKNRRFQEIQTLKNLGIGMEIEDQTSFKTALNKAFSDGAYRTQVEQLSAGYFNDQRGASKRILDWINGL
jgi:3-deoxy-D-manno-octulosonic-acid transferase